MRKSAFFCKCGCGLPQISVSLCRMRNLKKIRTYLIAIAQPLKTRSFENRSSKILDLDSFWMTNSRISDPRLAFLCTTFMVEFCTHSTEGFCLIFKDFLLIFVLFVILRNFYNACLVIYVTTLPIL